MLDRAKRRAATLPMPRIVALMLGGATAFFCLAMPPRVIDRLFVPLGLPAAGAVGHLLFALFWAALAGTIGWLAVAMVEGRGSVSRPTVIRALPDGRRRPLDPSAPMMLRRSDQHPDAPPRRPIFATQDLGTPFDQIVTDRDPATPAPGSDDPADAAEERLVFEDPMIEPMPAPVAMRGVAEAAAPEPVVEAPVVVGKPTAAEDVPLAEDVPAEGIEIPAETVAPAIDRAVEEEEAAPQEPVAILPPVRAVEPQREDTLAEMLARFEGGLDRLGDGTLPPPPPPSAIAPLIHPRSPDDALRDALEALQRMAARQR